MKRTSIPLVLAAALASLAFQARPPQGPAKGAAPAARPSPTPPPRFEGLVKGPDGKPVEKALVMARPVDRPAGGDQTVSTRTDATGRFQLAVKGPMPHHVRVEAEGLAATRLNKVRPGTPLTVTLGKGGAIEGVVRDARNAPVGNARVVASDEAAFMGAVRGEPDAGLVRATSDAKGYFRLQGLSLGTHTLTARARGAGSARRAGVRVGSRVDFLLMPGASIFGRVTGPGGRPVSGASVAAEMEERQLLVSDPPGETTDADGRFELLGLAPGGYNVVVHHADHAPGVVMGVALDKEGSAKVDVALTVGLRVVGRLVGAEAGPVAGRVQVQEMDGRPAPRALGTSRAEAGADGRFSLPTLPAGSYLLAVLGLGHAAQRVEVTVPATGTAPVDLGDVMLEVGLAIRGRVRDQAGLGLEGAAIRAMPDRPGRGALNIMEGRSEAGGRFVLAGMAEGHYRVTARLSGYAEATQSAATGADGVELVLTPGGTITGQVVDESNRPIDSFSVDAEPTARSSGGGIFVRGGRGERVVDPDGRFAVDGLGEGTYVVRAETAEMVAASVSGVKVTAGQAVDVGRIRLSRGGTVRGTVVDSTGGPVPGATISVRGAGNEMIFRGDGATVTTDGAGMFEARGVPPGRADIVASHPDYASARVAVDVEPSKTSTDARLVLAQGGRIAGWARKRDGAPLPGRIQVAPAQMSGMDMSSRPAMVTVGGDGSFVVEHVPAGRHRVLLMQGTPTQLMSATSKEVEVREGETATVELTTREILVSGRVTRSGVPQPAVRVEMRPRSGGMMMISMGGAGAPPPQAGPQRGSAVTREDGSYELLLDDSGEAMVRLETADGRATLLSRTETVPDAESHVLDFALTGVTLSGVVIDKATEKGVERARVTASPKAPSRDGPIGVSGQTGPDGRFHLEVEPGDVRLRAVADGYAERILEINVGQAGAGDLRLELGQGQAIEGRIVDSQGRPLPGVPVSATSAGPKESRTMEFALGLSDGSFRLDGLASRPHALLAGSGRTGYAFQAVVAPGARNVVLAMQPGGKAQVRVLAPDGQPADGAMVMLESLGGVAASLPMSGAMTDSQGLAELELPAGDVGLGVRKGELRAAKNVSVGAGGVAALELTLRAEPPSR